MSQSNAWKDEFERKTTVLWMWYDTIMCLLYIAHGWLFLKRRDAEHYIRVYFWFKKKIIFVLIEMNNTTQDNMKRACVRSKLILSLRAMWCVNRTKSRTKTMRREIEEEKVRGVLINLNLCLMNWEIWKIKKTKLWSKFIKNIKYL